MMVTVAGSHQKGYQYLVLRYASNTCLVGLANICARTRSRFSGSEVDGIDDGSFVRIFIDNGSIGFEINDASSTRPQLSNDPGVVEILGKDDAKLLCCICLNCGVKIYQLRCQKHSPLISPHSRKPQL